MCHSFFSIQISKLTLFALFLFCHGVEPMVFQGEEIFQGLRGFTYGYDYYTAEISVAFHMYAIKENKAKRSKVRYLESY